MAESLEEIERWVGQRLPEPYRTFLAGQVEYLPVGDVVMLYGRESFIDPNEACQVKQYAPHCISIGNDSGGREILLALTNGRIGRVDAGDMNPANAYPLAEDFASWLAGGCDLLDPPDVEHPDRIDVYLLRPPAEGLKGLMRVLKLLDLTVPVSEYRTILSETPYRLARDVDYLRYGWRSAEHNQTDGCLGASLVDQPDQPVRLEPRDQTPWQPPPGLDLT